MNKTHPPQTYAEAYDDWWQQYPRKVGKRAAFNKWRLVVREIADERDLSEDDAIAWLLKTTAAFANSEKAKSDYCPHPTTWLNQGRYDDDPAEWGAQPNRIETNADKLQDWRP